MSQREKRSAPVGFRTKDTGKDLNGPLSDFSDNIHKRLLALESHRKVVDLKFKYNITGGTAGNWPQRVALPKGFTPRCVYIGRIFRPDLAGSPAFGVGCPGWHVDGDSLCIDYIGGLANGIEYTVTLELTT